MSPSYDLVPDMERLGYTEREAAFLYLVAIHSGYCLRRQFLRFIERADGAVVQRFLKKTVEREHLLPIEYATGRHIYHLKAKLLYGLINQPDSQSRREKSDLEIKLRLMQLDYVLDRSAKKFLESARAKVEFFLYKLGPPMTELPRCGDQTSGGDCNFPDRMPIAITERYSNSPLVSFAYVDEGQRSLSAFVRWLGQHNSLLYSLPHAEVVYVADTPRNFDAAEHEFTQRLSRSPVTIRGHLLEYDYPLWSMKYRSATL